MALIKNVEPKDNPLAIKIELKTIINNIELNPGESYTVKGPSITVTPENELKGLETLLSIGQSIKMINLLGNNTFLYSIYYPTPPNEENYLYLIPSKANPAYESGIEDFVRSEDLDIDFNSSVSLTWREAARKWINDVVGFAGNQNTVVETNLKFSFVGNNTNRTEKTGNFNVALKYNSTN